MLSASLILSLAVVTQAPACNCPGGQHRPVGVSYGAPYAYTRPVTATVTTTATHTTTYAADPNGWFIAWLNGYRARYGLRAVAYDPNLANWAAINNSHQRRRGLGHFVMGPARRQNSAYGAASQLAPMWSASRLHNAALLDPSIQWIGLAGDGTYWTFNAR